MCNESTTPFVCQKLDMGRLRGDDGRQRTRNETLTHPLQSQNANKVGLRFVNMGDRMESIDFHEFSRRNCHVVALSSAACRCFSENHRSPTQTGRPPPLRRTARPGFLGTLAGMTEIAVIRRWSKKHWKELQTSLGFTRKTPAATTISRTLAQYSVEAV